MSTRHSDRERPSRTNTTTRPRNPQREDACDSMEVFHEKLAAAKAQVLQNLNPPQPSTRTDRRSGSSRRPADRPAPRRTPGLQHPRSVRPPPLLRDPMYGTHGFKPLPAPPRPDRDPELQVPPLRAPSNRHVPSRTQQQAPAPHQYTQRPSQRDRRADTRIPQPQHSSSRRTYRTTYTPRPIPPTTFDQLVTRPVPTRRRGPVDEELGSPDSTTYPRRMERLEIEDDPENYHDKGRKWYKRVGWRSSGAVLAVIGLVVLVVGTVYGNRNGKPLQQPETFGQVQSA